MRKARILAEHTGYYHVILKATGPQFLFQEDADKQAFQDILERSARFSGVGILAFALLDNHFHILVRVPERASVPEDEFRRRVEALYGHDRAAKLFDRWDRWSQKGREAEVAFKNVESVPMSGKRITPVPQCEGLYTATRLRGTMFRVA